MNRDKFLLLQNNNANAVRLECAIFADAIKNGMIETKSENKIEGIKALVSKRKIQMLIGFCTKQYILSGTQLERYLIECHKMGRTPIILFLNSFFAEIRYPFQALMYLKKKYNAHYVLYFIDTIEKDVSLYAYYLFRKKVFDLVYTFDYLDSVKYGIKYWLTPYSCVDIRQDNIKEKVDIYFCGVDSDRSEIINEISNNKKIGYNMDIISVEGKIIPKTGINLHPLGETLPYSVVLERTLEANTILEIMRPGQVGFTLRTFEAIVYNKKLLTNNTRIIESPFYDSRYVKVFDSVNNIDWNWVARKECVDYKYNGEFSPARFVEEIRKSLYETS